MSERIESVELSSYNQRKHDSEDPDDRPIWAPISRSSLMLSLYLIPPVLICASVVEIAFRAATPKKNASGTKFVRWTNDEEDGFMGDWPQSLFPNEDELPITSAALALTASVVVLGLVAYVVRNGPIKTTYWHRVSIISLLVLNALLALASTIYAFTLNSKSARFNVQFAIDTATASSADLAAGSPGSFIYDLGTFTRETWACDVRGLPNFNAGLGGKMGEACDLGIGARWLCLFIFLLGTGLLTVVLMDHRGGGHFMQSWKRRRAVERNNVVYA